MNNMQDWNFWEMLERSLPFIGVSVTGAFVRWARFGFRSVGGFLLSAIMAAFSARTKAASSVSPIRSHRLA